MEKDQHNAAHENDAELTVVRFDDGAKKAARPVVPLGRTFRRGKFRAGPRGAPWPLGLFIVLGLVLAAAALAGGFYHERHQDNLTPAPAATVVEAPPAAPQAVIETASSAAVDNEGASEPTTETSSDADAPLLEQASQPRRHRARSGPSFSYAADRFYADEDELRRLDDSDKDPEKRIERARKEAEKRIEKARKEAEKQAEHARKEAEKMAERARDEAKDRAEKRRHELEKRSEQRAKLVGVYTLRSRN